MHVGIWILVVLQDSSLGVAYLVDRRRRLVLLRGKESLHARKDRLIRNSVAEVASIVRLGLVRLLLVAGTAGCSHALRSVLGIAPRQLCFVTRLIQGREVACRLLMAPTFGVWTTHKLKWLALAILHRLVERLVFLIGKVIVRLRLLIAIPLSYTVLVVRVEIFILLVVFWARSGELGGLAVLSGIFVRVTLLFGIVVVGFLCLFL